MTIAIDFDGTVVTHEYPRIGEDIGAIPVLKKLVNCGHKLILLTMRSGKTLEEAVEWFNENNIKLWGINYNPTQHRWTNSNKVYANLYIDDQALGVPKKLDITISNNFFVDWEVVEQYLKTLGIIT